jgi:hypothetical protein
MAIKVLFTLLMYKLLAVITDDKGRKTGHSTSLRQIWHLAFLWSQETACKPRITEQNRKYPAVFS